MKLVDVPRYGDPHNGATWFFFRLTFNQAGGFYIPLITVMMIQMCTFSTNGGKAPTVTMIAMVASMVCVVIMTIQPVTLIRIFR
ncbi:hypothetical protein A8322_002502 [Escherichia coli]|nr:hypothetical protein [Escherichia coli]